MEPFVQPPLSALPEAPRVPHPFGSAPVERVALTTAALGRHEVAVRTFGAADHPPLLLVHGLMTTAYSFRYVVEPLARHFRVVVPDLPGAGDSDTPAGRLTPEALAGSLHALVHALGLAGCSVVGNSMGGYVCLWWGLLHPGDQGRLLVLHAPGEPLLRLHALRAALRLPGSRRLLGWLVGRDPEGWVHRNVHYWDESLKSREETRTYSAPLRTERGLDGFFAHLRDTMDPREIHAFGQRWAAGAPLAQPTLLLYARRDPMVPPVVGERLAARIPGAVLAHLEEGSHFAHVDRPALFLEAALPFLLARPGQSSRG